MNWIDVILLAIIVFSAWRGLASGLVMGLTRLAGFLLGLAFAFCYYQPVADYLDRQWHLADKINGWLHFLKADLLEGQFLPLEKFEQFFSRGLLEVLAFILVFLIVFLLTYWVGSMVAHVARWSFLGPADRLGGLILGIVQGVVIVLVVLALFMPLQVPVFFLPGERQENWLTSSIDNSVLIPVFWQFLTKLKMFFPGLPLV